MVGRKDGVPRVVIPGGKPLAYHIIQFRAAGPDNVALVR